MDFVETLMVKPYPFVAAIIQARMGSQRFPNKMMADLCGKPVIGHVIDRLRMSKLVHAIVVATPDEMLCDYANHNKAWGYLDHGDPNNVLARYLKAANWCNAELVVRICGDCPLIDPVLVDNCIKGYINNRVDISTNVLRRTYPKGLDVEVLHKNVLKRIFHLTDDKVFREHVTLYAYHNPALFKFHSENNDRDYSYFNLSVDEPSDLDKIREIVSMRDSRDFGYKELVEWLRTGKTSMNSS